MKKALLFLLTISLMLALCSCSSLFLDDVTVVFDFGNGEKASVVMKEGEKISFPELPAIENYMHAGWFYDIEGENPVERDAVVSSDITIYSFWVYDYASATNQIFGDHIRMNVSIRTSCYNTLFGMRVDEVISNGSGVIFDEDDTYYYCLTNNHVTSKKDGHSYIELTVTDCYGNAAPATIEYFDASRDLSVLKFKKGQDVLCCAEFADKAPAVGEIVINLGQPDGLKNALTYGEVLKYATVDLSGEKNDEPKVDFDVMWHDAPMNHGSSGGAVLNDKLELVGVSFAVGHDSNGEFLCGFTIPYGELMSFINEYREKEA